MSIGSTIPSGTVVNVSVVGLDRVDVAVATASIANGATDDGDWDLGYYASQLLVIESDAAGYLVLYANAAARTADIRDLPSGLDPDPGVGVFADFAFDTGGGAAIEVSPPVLLYNNDGSPTTDIYYRFYRSEAGTGVANLTLTILGLEE